ncbi:MULTISPECIES: ATP-binding protein [unclassified Ketobacter]|uniref:ATP-binding protein n=1 Tax=unclassified Ketobacter TaxID=2639109 RepID=UPI000F2BFFBB|nr:MULTISPECIES: ATP-binding protein [unclassified Ketobacter]RLT91622.1 MAG: hypothetical protein D9N13_04625 [Ketobacter sp. GenoA1]RLT96098.1 MAG: hypothetical protein D9N15_11595 [Ketobacter sp.]
MSQKDIWSMEPTYILKEIKLFNWGGFDGAHHAAIDPMGTAVIGPTGSGKTTLVDALMTLICANPKYNLASTGGHESDRDLVSYVRGVSGAGDGGDGQSHIARPGKTVTGITATLFNGENIARLGAVLWFDDSSSSPTDMKRLWFFTTSSEQSLEHWITVQHEGGMRALRQLDKTETGIWTYPSKKAYLSRIRDFFEVRENAFNLLNRAAGLKQLNSIDDIFRELVLDDTSQFDRAKEVADSFDDLTAIHEELEIARRQQRSLEPVKLAWEKYTVNSAEFEEKSLLSQILPVWFGEQAYQLWKTEYERLVLECQRAEANLEDASERLRVQESVRDNLKESYLQLGGSDIQVLEALIEEKRKNLDRCQGDVYQYQLLAQKLGLSDAIDRQSFIDNQSAAQILMDQVTEQWAAAENAVFEQGSNQHHANQLLTSIKEELSEVELRPGSNIKPEFQAFRAALAAELNLAEDDLPFVAELVQVREDQAAWRGAIERAIGNHRLRILVPPESTKDALRWINNRHNALHVRVMEVKDPKNQPVFWEDGFTRKLEYKPHPYRETVKDFLAGIDRHCVSSTEELQRTPHAMTQQGLMSGKARFFDKQDQKRLDQDWSTGFDNRDRLAFLKQEVTEAEAALKEIESLLEKARSQASLIAQRKTLLEQLQGLEFDQINIDNAQQELDTLKDRLSVLTSPDSDVAAAKIKLEEAEQALKDCKGERDLCLQQSEGAKKDLQQAKLQKSKAFNKAEVGMNDNLRDLARSYFPVVQPDQINDISDIEKSTFDKLSSELDVLQRKRTQIEKDLVRYMSDAKKEDRGALSEVGRELEDVPQYLERLTILIEEALPEKRQRFQDYLNRSSDEGVTQLLTTIDSEVDRIEEKLEDLNSTLRRVDFQANQYMQLVSNKVIHESLRSFSKTRAKLASARFVEDEGESQYKVLQEIVALLRDACERNRIAASKALLDPRFRIEFKVSVIDRATGKVVNQFSGSQSRSGGEKEIIASYVLTASLSYALCPDGSSRPLFGTIVLDEAFSRSSHAVAGRIIAALKEFGLHALFITPNKEMRLLRKHTRSAIVVHRKAMNSTLTPLSWQALDELNQQRLRNSDEVPI